jgi:NTP pyrophosphatase (non-canonical NTP hydrolase)
MKFEKLRKATIKRTREWTGEKLSLSFRGLEMAGEAGEACNEIKKLERERLGLVGSRTTLDKVAEELADVIISTDLIGMELGIDLGEAVKNKFNKTSENYGLKTRIE